MTLPIPRCLEEISIEDLLLIAWEPELLDRATPLERYLLQRLEEYQHALSAVSHDRQRLLDALWNCAHPKL